MGYEILFSVFFLLFVFLLPTSFAKVNIEEVKSALILCNNDVILKQHDETANTSYIEGNGGVIALYLQKFSSRNGSNTFDLNYYTTVSGIKKVSVSKDSSIKKIPACMGFILLTFYVKRINVFRNCFFMVQVNLYETILRILILPYAIRRIKQDV